VPQQSAVAFTADDRTDIVLRQTATQRQIPHRLVWALIVVAI
jgi:hypothetical protein